MMKINQNEFFIGATGAAALVHSTWTLGTLMSGQQPQASISVEFFGWLIPALLLAFALDVGQVATSHQIRTLGLTPHRAVTFGVFCLATYYLQWAYMVHHVPNIALANGVRAEWSSGVGILRDFCIWIIPALMPLATLLYTLSGQTGQAQTIVTDIPEPIEITVPEPISGLLEAETVGDDPIEEFKSFLDQKHFGSIALDLEPGNRANTPRMRKSKALIDTEK